MNKLILSIACSALALAATSMDAQAKGGGSVSGFTTGSSSAPASSTVSASTVSTNSLSTGSSSAGVGNSSGSGTRALLSPLTSGSLSTSSTQSGQYSTNTVYGYASPVSNPMPTAKGSLMATNDTGALQLNQQGVYVQVGMTPGSLSSGKGVSLVGQSEVNGNALGIGNSQVSTNHMGIGNSEGSQTAMVSAEATGNSALAAFKAGSPSTATDIMGRIANLASKAMGTNATQGPTMGAPVIKACSGSSGTSTGCN